MLHLYIGEQVLDLPSNVSIRIKRSNPAYLGEDVGVIKSTFSYPFELPLTARNRAALSFPDRLDNAAALPQDLPARIVAGPDNILVGKLNCLSSTRDSAKVYFVNNPLADLSKIKINEVDMGRFSYSSTAALQANMRDTYVNPVDRPYIVFPVFNGSLNPTDNYASTNDDQFQNSYNFNTGSFRMNHPISLFLRAEYVLRQAMEALGYIWSDLFHITNEHKRITFITNRTLNKENGTVTLAAGYNTLMPDTTVAELLKQYCRLFCLAPFGDLTGNTITLQPLSPLIGNAPGRDWSDYAAQNYSREAIGGVKRFAFPSFDGSANYRFDRWKDQGNPDEVVVNFPIPTPVPGRLYYVLSRNTYVTFDEQYQEADGSFQVGDFRSSHGSVTNFRGDEDVIPTLHPIQQSQLFFYPQDGDNCLMPVWSASIAPPVATTIGSTNTGNDEVEIAICIYRGQQRTSANKLYPFAGFNNFQISTDRIPDEKLSLRWLGEDGLYANHWRDWDDMLKSTTAVERTFLLPLSELISFDFRDKVRVGNKNYFVREIEFQLSAGGVSPTQCVLVAVS
jgi:hypothetical protein